MLRGYADPVEVVPGTTINLHARALSGAQVSVQRWTHGDPHPDGPGAIVATCDWGSAAQLSTQDSGCPPGSFATARLVIDAARGLTVCAWVCPTELSSDNVLLACQDRRTGRGARLTVSRGMLVASAVAGEPIVTEQRIRERTWHFVGACWHLDGSGVVFSSPWGRTGGPFTAAIKAMPGDWGSGAELDMDLLVGSANRSGPGELDGLVTGVQVFEQALDIVQLMDVMNGFGHRPDHAWDFADRRAIDQVPPLTPADDPLHLHQAPSFSGQAPHPVDTAGHPLTMAGSIHFHRDDLADCRWPIAQAIEIPPDAEPGFYCIRLQGDGELLDIPFVVQRASRVSLLASTLTWQAYGNLGRDDEIWPGRSHYSLHSDGSPVIITTSRRPCPTYGPQARLEVDGGDGFALGQVLAHLLCADLYAWHWLDSGGRDQGLVGDRALHVEGVRALDGVDVLVLSAHPEYWTSAMLDALQAFIDRGGSLIYLGGNGLYWVTSLHPTKPYLMEVRRWGGSQTCSVEPEDRWHQFQECLGGLWAQQGRPPNSLVGVGFTGFGAGPSMTFTRTAASHDPAWSWAFDGIAGEQFGAQGINTGAGNEFDCWDPQLPGPGVTTVLASSIPQTPDHFGVFERGASRAPDPTLRADLAVTQTPVGGLVLAVSSISASGCLAVDATGGGLGRVCGNILDRMLALADGRAG